MLANYRKETYTMLHKSYDQIIACFKSQAIILVVVLLAPLALFENA